MPKTCYASRLIGRCRGKNIHLYKELAEDRTKWRSIAEAYVKQWSAID